MTRWSSSNRMLLPNASMASTHFASGHVASGP
jgi:hypothetical protein